MSKKTAAAAEAETDLLTGDTTGADDATATGVGGEPGSSADGDATGPGEDLAAQLEAAKAELAEVIKASETAIGELKAERDRLVADQAKLTEKCSDLVAEVASKTALLGLANEELGRIAAQDGHPDALEAAAVAGGFYDEVAPSEPHHGPYVVMKTSSIVGADGQLVARNRIATGENGRLRALVEDGKARRATYAEVAAALGKEQVARLA